MKKLIGLIAITGMLVISSCCSKKTAASSNTATSKTAAKKDYKAEGYTKATVIDMTGLDGCGFMLVLEDGKKLETSIKDEFKKNELKVWIKYHADKNTMSICMSGKKVVLDAIEKE